MSYVNEFRNDEEVESKPSVAEEEAMDEDASSPSVNSTDTSRRPTPSQTPTPALSESGEEYGNLPFPSTVELNGCLRRLVNSYQRIFKKEEHLKLQKYRVKTTLTLKPFQKFQY